MKKCKHKYMPVINYPEISGLDDLMCFVYINTVYNRLLLFYNYRTRLCLPFYSLHIIAD